jgi:hypothetical protein
MRRRIVWLVVGVLVWVGVATAVYRSLTPDDVPLRVGMHYTEIPDAVGTPYLSSLFIIDGKAVPIGLCRPQKSYLSEPDWFGNSRLTTVYFDEAGRVEGWETSTESCSHDERLRRYRKTLGW